MPIWYAASSTVPICPATKTAMRKIDRRATVRTIRAEPARSWVPIRPRCGARPTWWRRASAATSATYTSAPTHWAITVERAEAPMPKSNTIRSTTSITRLISAVPKPTYNGVRVSWCPRRKPAPAITINNAGNPAVEMRRYVTASATTAASAPKDGQGWAPAATPPPPP